MAEIVVSAVVHVLVEKLISGDLMKLARSEGIDSQLKKWKKSLQLIQAVLADAGQKHVTQKHVEVWLHELQDLAYDIDDVLDDMATEAFRRKLNQEPQTSTSTSKVLKIIPTCCTNYTPHNILYGRKISSKLDEITNKLHDLVEEKSNLGLNVNVKVERSNRTNKRLEQTSLVDESKVLGREGDKDALLEKLLGDEACNQNVSVVSIVGLGGIGKTTLAKVLYNDDKVKAHFELRAWVCVSEEFDVFNISKAIFQAVNGENKDFANLDLLHVALKEKLSRKKFLVVLDDVWNEDHNEWELLQGPFVAGAPGSKIIITTRKTKVATVMNSFEPYNLEVLSNEAALSLFARCALDEEDFDKHPSLKVIAHGITKKCHGLPLALIALGRVLKTKVNEDEWEELLNSEIWNLRDGSDILPALKLSYYDLPPDLKQLFAYCSIFPKDHLFDKNKLALLWMAQGFLSQSMGNKSMESLGCHYFEELKSRSFFQHSANDVSLYTMHDLMNDLAVSVAREFNFMLDDKIDVNGRTEVFEKLRHFSFVSQPNLVYRKFKELHRAKCLRTFLPVPVPQLKYLRVLSLEWTFVLRTFLPAGYLEGIHQPFFRVDNCLVQLMPQLKYLRVLSLANGFINEVPQSIGSLIHLRYLNFSKTYIKQISEQVSNLYNLQSLLVRDCMDLSTLPVSFVKLINLRHLDIGGTPLLKKMPLGIGGLTGLQTLSKVCIEGPNGFKIYELKGLSELQGRLAIEGLDKVIDPTQATDASLQQKKGLDDLNLEWSSNFDDNRNSMVEYQVLERLRPYCKLRKLKILWYGGLKFPSWVGDSSFDQLTELVLEGCRKCTHLPTLGHLSSLRKFSVKSMHEVKTVGPFKSIALPFLESLEVEDMQGLEMWSTDISFPRLHSISIIKCPKFDKVSIGLLPSLNTLFIRQCCEPVFKSIAGVSSSISRLILSEIKGLTQLQEVLKHIGAVEDLVISSCDELRYLWKLESEACMFLTSLRRIDVHGCESLVSLGEKEVNVGSSMESVREVVLENCKMLESYNCPNNVESLTIRRCSSMSCLTFSNPHKLPSSPIILDVPDKGCDYLRPFPNFCLKYLEINECKKLNSFPHEHLQCLTSLEEMEICDCPNMDYSFPCGLWPPNLKKLAIGCLKKPMSEWGLQNYPTSLVTLQLYGRDSGVVSFEMEENASNATSKYFLLPSSLTSLTVINFTEAESLSEVLQHLPRLQVEIWFCPKLQNPRVTT